MAKTPFALGENLCKNVGKYFVFFAFFAHREKTLH